ncbi:hypothetical protein [Paenibacillus sp. OAS669]|uniref:hypothetical protein n=1 Tax=Paenibacillus sp. OAS669 TaxID=2663821 RepID=UPI00178AF043|nr:hypothetical protein [Paenibacillus sp. OAS669]MBE1442122.1 hypothetical protein [Paenibacillus sp. OAS669]
MKFLHRIFFLLTLIWFTCSIPLHSFAAGEEELKPNMLTLTESTALYEEPNLSSPTGVELQPQMVKLAGSNRSKQPMWEDTAWYQIETWLGYKWIYVSKAIPFRAYTAKEPPALLMKETELYDAPFLDRGTGIKIAPQYVDRNAFVQGYFRISTWLGEKWIPIDEQVIVPQPMEPKPLKLVPGSPVYDKADYSSKPARIMETPVRVVAFEKYQRWYHIHTENGDAWYSPFIGPSDKVAPADKELNLPEGIPIREYAFDTYQLHSLCQLSAQTIRAYEKRGDWYHVQACGSDGWVLVPDPAFRITDETQRISLDIQSIRWDGERTILQGRLKLSESLNSLDHPVFFELLYLDANANELGRMAGNIDSMDSGDINELTLKTEGNLSSYSNMVLRYVDSVNPGLSTHPAN